MKVLLYFESFYRLFVEQKPFETPVKNAIKLIDFFIHYPQRRALVEQHIEQEVFRYRSLQNLAENTIKNQSRINVER